MADLPEMELTRLGASAGYSGAVRNMLVVGAVVITLLPIPVVYFGILPTYQDHARFLLFYAPFLCLLTMCYLFYVRDSLGRAMFADVLDPPLTPDPYYRKGVGESLGRRLRGVKGAILMILPALLVIGSMYSVSQYLGALDQSVALATEVYIDRAGMEAESGMVKGEERRLGTRVPGAPRSSSRKRISSLPGPADTLPEASDTTGIRQYLLRTSRIGDIPLVVELTGWFIGSFLALLIAVTLMALKEYAKEALELSEHDLVFGRYYRSGANE
jgi:hypothetical protein